MTALPLILAALLLAAPALAQQSAKETGASDHQKPAVEPQQTVPGITPPETSKRTDSGQPIDRRPTSGPEAQGSGSTTQPKGDAAPKDKK